MWHTTSWFFRTWLKVTLALAVGVGVVWLCTDRAGYVVLAVIGAGLAECWTVRQLCREWAQEARYLCWWWPK